MNICVCVGVCVVWIKLCQMGGNNPPNSHRLFNKTPSTRYEKPPFKPLTRGVKRLSKQYRHCRWSWFPTRIWKQVWRYHTLRHRTRKTWTGSDLEAFSLRNRSCSVPMSYVSCLGKKQSIVLHSCVTCRPQQWPAWQKTSKVQ